MNVRSRCCLPNLDEVRAFYQRLGFAPWFGLNARWTYEIMSRGELVLHFFADRDLKVSENCSGCYVRVKDADALHRECAALNIPEKGIPRISGLRIRSGECASSFLSIHPAISFESVMIWTNDNAKSRPRPRVSGRNPKRSRCD